MLSQPFFRDDPANGLAGVSCPPYLAAKSVQNDPMKHRYRCALLNLLLFATAATVVAQTTPRALRTDLTLRPFYRITNVGQQVRIAYDSTRNVFYTIGVDGGFFQLVTENGSVRHDFIADARQHGIDYLQGLAVRQGVVYLVGNHTTRKDTSGYGLVKRGQRQLNGSWTWTTVMRTAEHASSKTLYDHAFSGVCFSPDGQFLYISSGSRTDHGEVKDNGGVNPGLREEPLTSKIFRIPATATDLLLPNDEARLQASGYVFARGVRNAFDIAFSPSGDLFSVENSGDRDDPEEMNWLREGQHYGFPWELGGNDTPMQFPDYDPKKDKLVNPRSTSFLNGGFANDPSYPKKPTNIAFQRPIRNVGPDADKYRDASTGAIRDASEEGRAITTFTAHRCPLGLVFDTRAAFGGEYAGQAFVLGHQKGTSDPSGLSTLGSLGPMNDPGEDLLLMNLTKTGGGYTVSCQRIAGDFNAPVDGEIVGNALYVLEVGGQIWEVTFPKKAVLAAPGLTISNISDGGKLCEGTSLTLTAAGYGSYQWYRNGALMPGESGARLTVGQAGSYQVAGVQDGQVSPLSAGVVVTVVANPPKPTITANAATLQASSASGNEWFLNGAAITGATAATLEAKQSGTYTVRTTVNGCSATSDPFVFTLTDQPLAMLPFRIYPNPSTDLLRFDWPEATDARLTVTDFWGRVLHRETRWLTSNAPNELMLNGLKPGVYLLRVQTAGREATRKVVIGK